MTLLDIISQRDGIAKAIDAEFDGLPAQEAGTRTYYCYRRGCMVTGTAYDLGAKRSAQRSLPELDGIKDRKNQKPRKHTVAVQRDKVAAWLRENGPATTAQITAGTGVPVDTVRNKLSYDGLPVSKQKITNPAGTGLANVWTWIGEE